MPKKARLKTTNKESKLPKGKFGEVYFSWNFPEYIRYNRTKWWYLGIGIAGGLVRRRLKKTKQ